MTKCISTPEFNKLTAENLVVGNELKKLETCDSIYFQDKSHFEDDGIQNWLVFQTVIDIFKQLVLMIAIFYHGNLKDCQIKVLSLLLHLIKWLILHWVLLVLKEE